MVSKFAFLGLLTVAAALPNGTPTLGKRAACTPRAGGSASVDDVPAIISCFKASATIVLPASSTYYANSVLDFAGCTNCDFQIEGLLKFTSDTSFWNGKTAMININKISGLKVCSLTGSGVIDGNGQSSWDKFATDSSYKRPTLLYITGGSNLQFTNFRQKNPPNVFNSVKGDASNVIFSGLTMDATSKSSNLPKNTDGFDIGASTFVTVTNTNVSNDDDCIAFKPGANYVTVTEVTCTGSHGISVGSLGKSANDFVKNVYAGHITMIDSTKAAGIKTYPMGNSHGVSTVSNVTFEDFTVQNCDYAFQIQSCYGEDASYCKTNGNNAQLTGIVVKGFSGTTSSRYAPTTANLNCGSKGTCDVSISGWTVKAPSGTAKVLCSNTPSKLGVTCSSGASG